MTPLMNLDVIENIECSHKSLSHFKERLTRRLNVLTGKITVIRQRKCQITNPFSDQTSRDTNCTTPIQFRAYKKLMIRHNKNITTTGLDFILPQPRPPAPASQHGYKNLNLNSILKLNHVLRGTCK